MGADGTPGTREKTGLNITLELSDKVTQERMVPLDLRNRSFKRKNWIQGVLMKIRKESPVILMFMG